MKKNKKKLHSYIFLISLSFPLFTTPLNPDILLLILGIPFWPKKDIFILTVVPFILWKPYRGIHNALHKIRHLDPQLSAKDFTNSLVDGINQLGEQLADYEHTLTFQKERLQIHAFEKAIYRGLYNRYP